MKDNATPSDKTLPQIGWALALDRSPVFLSVLLLLLAPFLTRTDGVHPLLPKLLLFRVVVFGLLTAFVIQCARYRRLVWVQAPVWFPLSLLLAWVCASALLSPYRQASLHSLQDGLLPFFWFALLFLLFREIWRVENLLMSFLAGSLALSWMVLFQKIGWKYGIWEGLAPFEFQGRWVGGLGNNQFLVGYLLTAWPLALALLIKAQHVLSRTWWSLTLASVLAALMATESWAGCIGLFVGAVLFAAIHFKNVEGQPNKGRWFSLSFLLVVLIATPWTPAGKCLVRSFQSDNPDLISRKEIWSGTWNMIRERPLLGVGFGAFETALPSYRPASMGFSPTQPVLEENHAHNLLLEWTAETGCVGLLFAIYFWIAVLAPWWKLTSVNAIPRSLGAAALAVFAGVLASNLFDDNHAYVTTLYPLLMVAALPAALSQRFHFVDRSPVRVWVKDAGKYAWIFYLLAVLAVGLFVFQISEVFKTQAADLTLSSAVSASKARDWPKAFDRYEKTLERRPDSIEARYFLASTYLERNEEGDSTKALVELNQVGKVSPDFAFLHLKFYEAFTRLGRLDEAKWEWYRAVQLDPQLIFRDPRFLEERVWTKNGNPEKALAILDFLTREYPDHFLVRMDRSENLVLLKRFDGARSEIDQALAIWPESVDALLKLGYVASAQGDRSGLSFALRHLQALSPNDPRLKTLRDSTSIQEKDAS
jgi:O-antigen ligase/Flp pilus assembly protein TadD